MTPAACLRRGGAGAYTKHILIGVGIVKVAFHYTLEVLDALQATLSTERIKPYVVRSAGDLERALRSYVFNTEISEAFYTPLQGLEIALRNAVHGRMTSHFGEEWYSSEGVRCLQHPLTRMIDEARLALARDKKAIAPGRMVAELSLGFWVTILGPKCETPLWRPVLRHAFPHRPRGTERKEIQGALNAIRRLRNRVAHHEPILDRDLAFDHEVIITLIGWICPQTAAWVAAQSRVPAILATRTLATSRPAST